MKYEIFVTTKNFGAVYRLKAKNVKEARRLCLEKFRARNPHITERVTAKFMQMRAR